MCVALAAPTWALDPPAGLDSDNDGVLDAVDSCPEFSNPEQTDSDGDGFGDRCDADYNGDCVVGGPDFAIFRSALGTSPGDPGWDPAVDSNGDGLVGGIDFGTFRRGVGHAPGPGRFACLTAPSREEAARFLLRATFGVTEDSIADLQALGYQGWIDAQLAIPATDQLGRLEAFIAEDGITLGRQFVERRMDAWWETAVEGPDQLRQRVAFALSQIFVISEVDLGGAQSHGIADYNDMLAENAFGTYRQLIEDVTLHPMMGDFLSMRRNEKANPAENIQPDENYAREILQLLSIGTDELGLDGVPVVDAEGLRIPSYGQDEILNFARVFTGWNYGDAPELRSNQGSITIPMTSFESFHDRDSKVLLGAEFVPGGLDAPADMARALDNITNHPNVGPFIGKQLIQHLVTSNPSPAYVARVANVFNDDGQGVRGNLGAVVRAVLLDREAFETQDDPSFGKPKDPILRVAQLWRAFDGVGALGRLRFSNSEVSFAQRTLSAPSVFNFFRPDFSPPGPLRDAGMVAPAFQIVNEGTITSSTNQLFDMARSDAGNTNQNGNQHPVLLDTADLEALMPDAEAVVDELDLRLTGGTMSDGMREILIRTLDEHPSAAHNAVEDVLFLALSAPEVAIQR